jgi:hypothetical protein
MQDELIHDILTSQYLAALETLRRAVAACPSNLWTESPARLSAFWRVAHHTFFFADLYLHDEQSFKPWPKHVDDHHDLGPFVDEAGTRPPGIGTPTTRDEMLEFADYVKARVPSAVRAMPLDGPSGWHWQRINKLEMHVYNIRHIQHHAAVLVARLRERAGIEVDWVGKGRPA